MTDLEQFDLLMEESGLIPLDLFARLTEQGYDVDEMIDNWQ